jgi:uncharacterized membrane protein
MNEKVKKLTYTGIMAALSFIGTMIIYYRLPSSGYLHIGDSMVLLSGALLGPLYGGFAAGFGSMFADLAAGAPIWMISTFIIKFAMAAVMGVMLKDTKKLISVRAVIGMLIAWVILVAGYYITDIILVTQNFAASIFTMAIPCGIQGFAGSLIGTLVMFLFDKTKLTDKIKR